METIGPFARAFGSIVSFAASKRIDIPEMRKLLEETGTKLYRAAELTEEDVKTYKDLQGKA